MTENWQAFSNPDAFICDNCMHIWHNGDTHSRLMACEECGISFKKLQPNVIAWRLSYYINSPVEGPTYRSLAERIAKFRQHYDVAYDDPLKRLEEILELRDMR